jgi:TldD protein
MMYKFPEDLYSDVRIETITTTEIGLRNDRLYKNKTKTEIGAMIRMFDGERWYYNATTDIANIQDAIDRLAEMTTPNKSVYECPEIKILEVNQDRIIRYEKDDISKIDNLKKLELVRRYNGFTKVSDKIKAAYLFYNDERIIKHFMSSKGTDVEYDRQHVRAGLFYSVVDHGIPTESYKILDGILFEDVANREKEIEEEIQKGLDYAEKAVPVTAGEYPCILEPSVAGVFAHESFGHKSEADFMMNDEAMRKEWTIGKTVGASDLSIADGGEDEYHGYVPYDDEGSKSRTTYLIKNGVLSGRLHNSITAACLAEDLTGNARAIGFEYEPIVRMSNTYILNGTMTKEELFETVSEGVYVESWRHGSGLSTFTIAPVRAYMIREGKIAEPVRVSFISGNVMDTLHLIDGISNRIEMSSGWCGKNEQNGLPVGQGGPYIRVKKLSVQ